MRCLKNSKFKKYTEVDIRPVEERDIKKIFKWRNEPNVRKHMFASRRITWREHVKFWESLLTNKTRFAFIIKACGEDCGVARLDRKADNSAEVDIFLSTPYQGKGIGSKALKKLGKKAKELSIKKLIAKVKPDNKPSIKMFEKNGFRVKYLVYERKN